MTVLIDFIYMFSCHLNSLLGLSVGSVFPGAGEALQLLSNGPSWSLLHANLRQIFVLSNNNRDSQNVPRLHSCFSWTEHNYKQKYLWSQKIQAMAIMLNKMEGLIYDAVLS